MAQTVLEGLYHLYLMAIWWPFETNNATLSESRFCEVVDFQDGAVLGTMLVETDIQSTHGKSQSLWLTPILGVITDIAPSRVQNGNPLPQELACFHVNNGERDILFGAVDTLRAYFANARIEPPVYEPSQPVWVEEEEFACLGSSSPTEYLAFVAQSVLRSGQRDNHSGAESDFSTACLSVRGTRVRRSLKRYPSPTGWESYSHLYIPLELEDG
ncbi:hypothetical protein FA13DRAFT_1716057 [Coprinellus micaceus]|uniref:Uncharacterized protein n=1 Tax=Coprinellus micaceus TaxID=71717 RepID=A0A4Y7SL11_COPMI|nr:hypothetical protein FA13DRAFT_1716057 [Coprinellus micaceus]